MLTNHCQPRRTVSKKRRKRKSCDVQCAMLVNLGIFGYNKVSIYLQICVVGLYMKKYENEEFMKSARTIMFQFAKFSAVGLTCFGVDYGLLIILTEFTSLEYFSSSAISFIVSTLLNYVLSMRFVFSGKEGMTRWAELLIFITLSVIGLGLNQMIMWIVVEEMKIFYLFAKILSSIIVSVFNFISRKVFLE